MSAGGVMFALQGMSQLYQYNEGMRSAIKNRRLARKAYGLEIEGINRSEKRTFEKYKRNIADFNVRGVEEREAAQDRMFQQEVMGYAAQEMLKARNLARNISGITATHLSNDLKRMNLKNVSKINNHLNKVQAQLVKGKRASQQGMNWFLEDSDYKRKGAKMKLDQRIFQAKDPDPMALALNMGGAAMQGYAYDKKLGNDWFAASATDDQSWTWNGAWNSMMNWFNEDPAPKGRPE
jgi:hypothetical protein